MLLYALTILVSAFLLFQVQPVIAKIILPWFGGSAAVWTACLLFFQMVLLLGYLYAHAVVRYLKPRMQMLLHCGLLLAERGRAAHLSPASPGSRRGTEEPTFGHPAPAGAHGRAAVFPALHHRPAAAGLVRAPLQRRHAVPALRALQRRLDVRAAQLSGAVRAGVRHPQQACHVVHGLRRVHGAVHVTAWRSGTQRWSSEHAEESAAAERPGARQYALWLLLPACASVLLLAITNHLIAERGRHPVPLGAAAEHLPAHLHPVLRRQRLVPPQSVPATAGGGAGRHGVCGRRGRLRQHAHQDCWCRCFRWACSPAAWSATGNWRASSRTRAT